MAVLIIYNTYQGDIKDKTNDCGVPPSASARYRKGDGSESYNTASLLKILKMVPVAAMSGNVWAKTGTKQALTYKADHYNVYFVKTQKSTKIFFSSTEKKCFLTERM